MKSGIVIKEPFEITIIGAGIVGLAIAEELASHYDNVLLVEKDHSYGQGTSSRNSEVIHAGIYYPDGFLKASLCREGNLLLYELCAKRNISHKKVGKLIVATSDDEIKQLLEIRQQALRNGIDNLSFLSTREIRMLEPRINAVEALFSPSTGIIDSHRLMQSFYAEAEHNGALIVFNSEVSAIHYDGISYRLDINDGEFSFKTKILINSAGLFADRIAALAGINVSKEGYTIHYCKGNYFTVSPAPRIRHLVYPVPVKNTEGLGVHATLDLGGRVKFGPDTEYVEKIDYTVDEAKRKAFCRSIKTYLPEVSEDSLVPDMCGIRPKLQGPGDSYRDFVIKEESSLGYPGLINLIGIESPGLTSCISIARLVSSLIKL